MHVANFNATGTDPHDRPAAVARHAPRRDRPAATDDRAALNRLALSATLHCLIGCSIGEVAGMVVGTALGWSNGATIALAVALAFAFGYLTTMIPLLRAGLRPRRALALALAADTASVATMEIVDNLLMLAIPGAMNAGLDTLLFWGSLAFALAVAAVAAYPVNRWLIARGKGHVRVHAAHVGNTAAPGADVGPGDHVRHGGHGRHAAEGGHARHGGCEGHAGHRGHEGPGSTAARRNAL